MKKIDNEEMLKVQGGGFSIGVVAGIIAAITFIVGVLDGYTNPAKCHN